MDTPSLGKYACVSDLPFSEKKITYNRGFGNVVTIIQKSNGKIETTSTPFNRIQPLMQPFGNHEPKTAADEFKILNPQTDIAWDNNPKYK